MNELSIIVPYDASTLTLSDFIDDLSAYLMENPGDIDIIIVANESAGFNQEIVRKIRGKYPWLKFKILLRHNCHGYGSLVRFGMAYSSSRYVVVVSPYGEDDLSIIGQMLKKMREGAQLVQTMRLDNESDRRIESLRFRAYQNIYRRMIKVLLGYEIKDSTYMFKMFDRPLALALGLSRNGYSISPEITLKVLLAGGKISYISSRMKLAPINKNFKLYKEGFGFGWVLWRSFLHRLGILWF